MGSAESSEDTVSPPHGDVAHIRHLARRVDPFSDVRAYRELSALFESKRPDIVHTCMAKAGALGRIAAKRSDVSAIVHTFDGHVLRGYFSGLASATFTVIERKLATLTDALIAVSEAVRDELLELGIGRPEQWRVIRSGYDLSGLDDITIDKQAARQKLGLPRHDAIVGTVGRLVSIKDTPAFIRAAARVAHRRNDVLFVVAGEGGLRNDLERYAHQLLGTRVRFLGWVRDLQALYRALDVVVLTSRNEGTPSALVEAGAAGLPVVATRVGGVPEIVVDGRTGLLTKPGDDEAIAAAVLALVEEPARAHRIGVEAKKWIWPRYSMERLLDEVTELYRSILDQRRATR